MVYESDQMMKGVQMKIINRAFLFLGLVGLIAMSSLAMAADGKAEGKLIVDGKSVNLAYAYAFAQPGFFDKQAEDIILLLTDVPLTGTALEDNFERINLTKQGKLYCVEVTIDAKKQPISVTVRHPSFKVSLSGGSTEDAFEATVFDGKNVGGRVFRKSPGKSFEDLEYTYDVTFSAAITRKPK
jgi:hypothetical protein